MRKGLFARLAVSNIRRNTGAYIPYMITCICCIAMTYMMFFITQNPNLTNTVPSYMVVSSIMFLGIFVICIFSFIFLLYSNSLLMKRRKREIGLYNILGLEKWHIMKMMLMETLVISVISLAAGIFLGILGSKLALLLLLKLLHVPAQLGFYVSVSGIAVCTLFFGFVFLITLISNARNVHLNQPVELLRGSSVGEKEPGTKWLLAFLGFVCLGAGYFIAVTVESPLNALGLFFVAVLLVMAGTYLIFTAGSIVVLKMMRRKKSFYYKLKNFTTVSGMIYRMKQNAMGLGSICILSTGVLLMISATLCLNFGIEDVMRVRYPYDVFYTFGGPGGGVTKEQDAAIRDEFADILKREQIPCERQMMQTFLMFPYAEKGDELILMQPDNMESLTIKELVVVSEKEYDRIHGNRTVLSPGEVLGYRKNAGTDSLKIGDENYLVQEWLKEWPLYTGEEGIFEKTALIVCEEDFQKLSALQQEVYGSYNYGVYTWVGADIKGSGADKVFYGEKVENAVRDFVERHAGGAAAQGSGEEIWFTGGIREKNYGVFYAANGGLLFLGIFLGTLFMIGTGMIIYYKQISEGYEDKERFEIMQKVGMSRGEVKSSIRRQILMVFFAPLLMAVLHISMAFPMMRRLLMLLGMMNTSLFLMCTAATIVGFIVIYALIYSGTAKAYYRIVERKA